MTEPYDHWAWVITHEDGREGMICAAPINRPEVGLIPLAHRDEHVAREQFGWLAHQHARDTGRAVRLVHMREVVN